MDAIRAMIEKTARCFGAEISENRTNRDRNLLFNQWVKKLQTTDPLQIVFDVGANRGHTVARFRTEFPDATIYAFEPGLQAFLDLKARTADDSKIKSFQLALGEYDGSATLHENSDDVTSSLLPNSPHISHFAPPEMCIPKKETTIPLVRMDTFCAQESINRIDLLKIDAQGYERYILDGAGSLLSPAKIRGLFLEVLFVDLYKDQTWCGEVLESLRSRGYRLFGFTDIVSDDIHGWKWADAMFVGNG